MALYGGSAMRGVVIGVDLGGTKLRAGVVDDAARIHHRTSRLAQGLDQPALLAAAEAAVREALDASRGEVSAVGFEIGRASCRERVESAGVRVAGTQRRERGK